MDCKLVEDKYILLLSFYHLCLHSLPKPFQYPYNDKIDRWHNNASWEMLASFQCTCFKIQVSRLHSIPKVTTITCYLVKLVGEKQHKKPSPSSTKREASNIWKSKSCNVIHGVGWLWLIQSNRFSSLIFSSLLKILRDL